MKLAIITCAWPVKSLLYKLTCYCELWNLSSSHVHDLSNCCYAHVTISYETCHRYICMNCETVNREHTMVTSWHANASDLCEGNISNDRWIPFTMDQLCRRLIFSLLLAYTCKNCWALKKHRLTGVSRYYDALWRHCIASFTYYLHDHCSDLVRSNSIDIKPLKITDILIVSA